MKETRVTLDDDPIVGADFLQPTTVEEQALLLAGSPFNCDLVGGLEVGKPDFNELHLGVVFDGQPHLALAAGHDVYVVVGDPPQVGHFAKVVPDGQPIAGTAPDDQG